METLSVLTSGNWEQEVLRSRCTVLVDFRTPSCPPFLLREDLLRGIAGDCGDCLKVGTVDVTQEVELAFSLRIEDLPTLVLFREGRPLKRFSGSDRLERLMTWWLRQETRWAGI
jgi:thioredoxin 1